MHPVNDDMSNLPEDVRKRTEVAEDAARAKLTASEHVGDEGLRTIVIAVDRTANPVVAGVAWSGYGDENGELEVAALREDLLKSANGVNQLYVHTQSEDVFAKVKDMLPESQVDWGELKQQERERGDS